MCIDVIRAGLAIQTLYMSTHLVGQNAMLSALDRVFCALVFSVMQWMGPSAVLFGLTPSFKNFPQMPFVPRNLE